MNLTPYGHHLFSSLTIASLITPLLGVSNAWGETQAEPGADSAEKSAVDDDVGYWQGGEERWFVATSLAVGVLSNAEVSLGYGRPQWLWGGLVGYALSTTEFGAVGFGPQLNLLIANALFRVRRSWSYKRHVAAYANTYDNESLVDPNQPRSRYTAIDGYLWGYLPIGPTLGIWGVRGELISDFPNNRAIFSEFLRFTLRENWAVMPRLSWWLKLLDDDLMLGVSSDFVLTPDRPPLFRLGPGIVYRLGNHLQAQALLTMPVVSPDDIGWLKQSWGTVRLEWNGASGETEPGFF